MTKQNYIVTEKDGGFAVVHRDDEKQYKHWWFNSKILKGTSMYRQEMQDLADKMNLEIS